MAKHKSTIIPPFPSDIDRDYFGAWLSGLTDGEGCFVLSVSVKNGRNNRWFTPRAMFSVNLREDDMETLNMIRSYFQCGAVYLCSRKKTENAKPMGVFRLGGTTELHNIIVPNFCKYPLIAKKRRDFEIWKEGVSMLYRVLRKPQIGKGSGGGTLAKWSNQDKKSFENLVISLKEVRKYRSQYKGIDKIKDEGNSIPSDVFQKTLW